MAWTSFELKPVHLARLMVVAGLFIGICGAVSRIPSFADLRLIEGRADAVVTRSVAVAPGSSHDLLVSLKLLRADAAPLDLQFTQPSSRKNAISALAGHKMSARVDTDGTVYELRVGHAVLQTYLQAIEPAMLQKLLVIVCGASFASVGLLSLLLLGRRRDDDDRSATLAPATAVA